jgi:Cu2+-exporting ATPase
VSGPGPDSAADPAVDSAIDSAIDPAIDPGAMDAAGAACCPVVVPLPRQRPLAEPVDEAAANDVTAYVRQDGDGLNRLDLLVDGVHCGACIGAVEGAVKPLPGVEQARLNLTAKRLALAWRGDAELANDAVGRIGLLGYRAVPFDPQRLADSSAAEERALLRALAVAGFAAANVMLLSVAVWAGHAQGMGEATRTMLHWFSALIALPATAYAGLPFFRSAFAALKHGRTNMDVPISVGVVLASAVSLHQTIVGGDHAYFDSAVTLLFFLLIGRFLDRRARARARDSASRLLALAARPVTLLIDGARRLVPVEQVRPGSLALVSAGEKVPVDGAVEDGTSDIDTAMLTGETLPQAARPGDRVYAGTVNLTAPLRVRVAAAGEGTLLADIVRLMEQAEARKGRFVGLADRVARAYAPMVHGLALAAFLGWLLIGGLAWTEAMMIAIAVLIITCPCALGLAVPAVQVVARSRLMRQGVLVKSGDALERAASIDTVVFDKTGTLTLGKPRWLDDGAVPRATAHLAASLAQTSRHPLARALAAAMPWAEPAVGVREVPGAGLEWEGPEGLVRLGSRAFCAVGEGDTAGSGLELWLALPDGARHRFAFADDLRPDAAQVVEALHRAGKRVILLSGDRQPTVAATAASVGIADWQAGLTPDAKVARLEALREAGARILMVGDGLNDAPALTAAHVSLSPASGADVSQTAADAVFQGQRLGAVTALIDTARRGQRLIGQNLGLAFGYNALTIPIALAGLVTPLIAAVAMSSSSIVVVLNALRLGWSRR